MHLYCNRSFWLIVVCFYDFQCNSSAVCESRKGFLLWFTDCLTIGFIHETMVVNMTWVWTFFNNYIYICLFVYSSIMMCCMSCFDINVGNIPAGMQVHLIFLRFNFYVNGFKAFKQIRWTLVGRCNTRDPWNVFGMVPFSLHIINHNFLRFYHKINFVGYDLRARLKVKWFHIQYMVIIHDLWFLIENIYFLYKYRATNIVNKFYCFVWQIG